MASLLAVRLHASAAGGPLAPLWSDYTHTSFGALQGAPVGVLQIAQGADGWLWVTSEKGLYRFDGTAFERVNGVFGQPLKSNDLYGLMAAKDGSLWVGYRLGGVGMFSKGGTRTFMEREGLPLGIVFNIEEAPDGAIWVGTQEGAFRLARGADRFELQGGQVGLPRDIVFQSLFARDGTQWIACASGAFFRRPGEQRFTAASHASVRNLKEGPDGAIWAMLVGDRYFRVDAAALGKENAPSPQRTALMMGFGRDGDAWVLTHSAVERKRDMSAPSTEAQRLTLANGLSGAHPQAFFQDREGNIWIGSVGGIDRFRRNRLQSVSVGLELMFPGMVQGPDRNVWISHFGGGIYAVSADGHYEQVSKERMTASHWAPDGVLWIASREGLRRRAPNGSVTVIAHPEGEHIHDTQALQQDSNAALWVSISGGGGLFQLIRGKWIRDGGLEGLPRGVTFVMAMDAQGTVWMGHQRNTISLVYAVKGKAAVRRLDAASGLQLGSVLSFCRDGKFMWAGGERGTMLYRDGRFVALRGAHGESFRGVSGIVRLPNGELWLHGVDGIYRIASASVEAWMRDPARTVDFERFDAQDGLRGTATQLRPLPSLMRASDGKLWFVTGSAIGVIDPAHIYRNLLAPPVAIISIAANEQVYAVEGGKTLTLPAGTTDLHLGFTAFSLSIPERVRFRYRLQGSDANWRQTLDRRAASYTNLAPGDYRFEVSAANEDGVWSRDPAVVDIHILPTFVQTRWFTLVQLCSVGALLYTAYMLRIRYISKRMHERHQVQLEERSRIARTLHDTMLQGVQGLLLSFDGYLHHVPQGSRERTMLQRTLDLGWRLVGEGREQIMNLRTAAAADELHLALQPYGKELAEHAGHAFNIRVTGTVRALKEEVHEEIYTIAREALFNASRYAHAHHVTLDLDYGAAAFTLRIYDDGRGLDPAVMAAGHRPGHWGLPGMRERAKRIDAGFQLASGPGEGTTIAVTLSAKLAYR
jgi:signal transduction histidine kinase/ligand-binding sensor domain-containing protein